MPRDGCGKGGADAWNLREAPGTGSGEGGDQGTRSWTGHLCWPIQAVSGGMTSRPLGEEWGSCGEYAQTGEAHQAEGREPGNQVLRAETTWPVQLGLRHGVGGFQ